MVACLKSLKESLEDEGYKVSGPHDLSRDEYRWYLNVDINGDDEQSVDISLEIAESLEYGDGADGINLSMDIVAYSGRILGGIAPYNYSDECWVALDDSEEIDTRMRIMEGVSAGEIIELLEQWELEVSDTNIKGKGR